MTKATNPILAILATCFVFILGFSFGAKSNNDRWTEEYEKSLKDYSYDYFEMGAQRAAIYTYNHGYMPSKAFREILFERPSYSDEDIEREAKKRYPPIGPRQN